MSRVRPEMSAQEQTDVGEELEVALAAEIAAGWRFYTDEARIRLGADFARTYTPLILRAINRAGLRLERK
jgi:hypothetical protein